MHFTIQRPQKKEKHSPMRGFHSCLRDCFLRQPRCAKTNLEKLGFGAGPGLTITGNYN
jgi:hypothetical protein